MRLGSTALSVTRPGSKQRPVPAGPPATYALSSDGSVNEGESMVVTVTTTNVTDGTVLYWSTSNITTSDSDFTATSGTTAITSNSGSFSVATVADSTTEGAETFGITLRVGSQSGTIVASTTNKTINDTSQTPSYSASSASNINEGSALGVTVTTTNVSDGTTLYWTNSHTTTSAADFSSNSGSFTITSNSGTFNVPVVADSATEGAETFTVEIRTTSTSGTIVATLPSVTVNDTSTAVSYSFSSVSEVDEGSALGCSVTTTGVSNGTTLYWTISHITTVAADFTNTSGSFTVNNNSGTFSVAIANDTTNENAETFAVQIRTGSTSGTVVETSNTITINNIFFDDVANYSYVRNNQMGSGPNNILGCEISPDGTKFYTLSYLTYNTRQIQEYTLSTPYDISSYSAVTALTLTNGSTSWPVAVSLYFKPDGTKLYVGNGNTGIATVASLSTPWALSTLSVDYTFDFTSPTAYVAAVTDIILSPDGTKLFTVDATSDYIRTYNLNTAWDIRSFSSTSLSQSLNSSPDPAEGIAMGMAFNNDGTRLYLAGKGKDYVQQFNLTTPYDLSSSSGFDTSNDSELYIGTEELQLNSLRFSSDGKYFYIPGSSGDDVTQYQR